MKKLLYPLALAVLVTACGEKVSELEKLKTEKKTKLSKIAEIRGQIREIDSKISTIDTSKKDDRIAVGVTKLLKEDFTSYVEVHGVVKSNQTVNVMPELSGVIKRISVREGQKVRKGQSLAYLDTDLIDKQIQELEKSLELAEEVFKKQKNMHEQNVGTEIQYLEAKNRKESIEQSIKTARAQRSKAIITSPVAGKVDVIYPNAGEMASPGAAFARIVNTSDVYVDSDVSEALYYKVHEGDKVVFRLQDQEGREVDSKVTYKGNFINPANRTFKIHSELKSTGDYPPNMLMAVKIVDTDLKNVYTIPRLLIQTDSKGNYVYEVVKDEKGKDVAQKLHVTVKESYGGKTVIESKAINEKTLVVDHGFKGLDSGSEVVYKNK